MGCATSQPAQGCTGRPSHSAVKPRGHRIVDAGSERESARCPKARAKSRAALKKLCEVLPPDIRGPAPRPPPDRGDSRSPASNTQQTSAMRAHPLFGPDLGDDDPDSRIDVDELEQSAGVYSSMDSSAWKTSATHSGPVPPDRRLHERHMLKMDRLWED
ncbi:unnamed protein product, partial [Symbiodinium microadriaticum]